jgi:hypothetical protein
VERKKGFRKGKKKDKTEIDIFCLSKYFLKTSLKGFAQAQTKGNSFKTIQLKQASFSHDSSPQER